MHYFAYLDEFGHIGPYISRAHPKHNTSPVFGLAGIALPVENVREFSTFFFQLKNRLLKFELEGGETHPAKWEKKGAALYTLTNINKYPELRKATNRYINKLRALGGFIFHTGIEKEPPRDRHSSEALYFSVLNDAIKRLNTFCSKDGTTFSLLLDSVDSSEGKQKFRLKSVEQAGRAMFGEHCACLLEPPYQLESHLYQNMQCADWICALMGRRLAYSCSADFPEFEPVERFFGARIDKVKKNSSFRRRDTKAKILFLPES